MNLPLLIGYGNTLRRDDGAGVWLVNEFSRCYPGRAHCLSVHQLGPELAEAVVRAPCVVFADASVAVSDLAVSRIEPSDSSSSHRSTHHTTPQDLLHSCLDLYGRIPSDCYVVRIPVRSLSWGETITDEVKAACRDAVEAIAELLDNLAFRGTKAKQDGREGGMDNVRRETERRDIVP
ncbi:MAG: hydrogenase maturation protease [Ignavibacteria bacterium]|nr:hydrogenase maturation protease [Ignavibacteria bacterium]